MTESQQPRSANRGMRLLAIAIFVLVSIALLDTMGWLTELTGGAIVATSTSMAVNLYHKQPKEPREGLHSESAESGSPLVLPMLLGVLALVIAVGVWIAEH